MLVAMTFISKILIPNCHFLFIQGKTYKLQAHTCLQFVAPTAFPYKC
uniref:Uncharacterized protein n=1 Tax=Anguilla anguilla TaxID=7936 RepID=A0A0E9UD89_ANGAN